jgi:hypothetical protein
MYLPVPTQPDCTSAWLQAVKAVDAKRGHEAYNVIVDVEDPIANANRTNPVVAEVESFLAARGKSVFAVANTIFPMGLHTRYGSPAFATAFRERVLPKVRRSDRWSGYYFDRMSDPSVVDGPLGPLGDIVRRMGDPEVRARNKFELSLFEPGLDLDDSPYGGQCLSFLSFKVLAGAPRRVTLTAQYRNHYYVEKLLGNLIGLGWLMKFVAGEAGLAVGPLTILSTHAEIDQPRATRSELVEVIARCEAARLSGATGVRSPAA